MNVVAAHMHVSGSVPVPEEDTEAPDLIISLLPHSLPVPSVLLPSSLLGLKFLPSSQQHTGNLEKNPRFSCSVRTLLKLFFQFLWKPLKKPIKSLLYSKNSISETSMRMSSYTGVTGKFSYKFVWKMASLNPEGLPFPMLLPTACFQQNEENAAK